ncbi:MAG: M48 family metalloprotease [Gemmatimonadota bacterium]|nr:M48 family metalloprotease [Gemmatimonadota bacterium]
MQHTHRYFPVVLTGIALAAAIGSCAVNPVTGKKELSFVSESQEIEMGRSYSGQIASEMGVYPDSGVQQYVSTIGRRMALASERPKLPWTFHVMDDPQVNAFALPGGYIFVTRGILAHMNSEAELASVVGHEIGHVTARHSVQQMTRTQLAQIGLVAGSIASETFAQYAGVATQGLGVLFLKYGRDDETQADGLGFRYALDDGYDVREMVAMFQILKRVGARAGQRIPEWQSSHPDPGNRIERTQQRLAKLTVPLDGRKVNRAGFLKAIDGMVYGDNPRQGYFNGAAFLHPDLAFRVDFPSGWRTANQPAAVVGVSPNRDAQVMLGVQSSVDPETALRKFLAKEGIQPGQVRRTTIHGNQAATAPFAAQGEGGVLNGRATYVAYAGNTYQLLGVTTAALTTWDAAFQSFTGSFRQLTDAKALGVQPNRLAVARVNREMTLAQFNRQYPSVIPMDELALINGVRDSTAVFPAGESVKRVVAK